MTRYRGGYEFECKVRKALIEDGYDLFRSAGSKTKVDLIALKRGQALFVQCKRDGKISPAERTELLRVAAHIDALPIVAWKLPRRSLIHYWRLTGPGPKDHDHWMPDEVMTDGNGCWLCGGLGGIALHMKWSEMRGKPLWTAHEIPTADPHPVSPCPACMGHANGPADRIEWRPDEVGA